MVISLKSIWQTALALITYSCPSLSEAIRTIRKSSSVGCGGKSDFEKSISHVFGNKLSLELGHTVYNAKINVV